MQIEVLKSKIHRATVTNADLNYIGSITIDEDLMEMDFEEAKTFQPKVVFPEPGTNKLTT